MGFRGQKLALVENECRLSTTGGILSKQDQRRGYHLIVWPRKSGPKLHVHVRRALRRTLSRWDLTTPPLPHSPTMQMLLESSFSFCTQQVTTRLHSGEAATAGEDGVNRTVARKSGRAAPAGGHHGGPRGATPSSQPGYPRVLKGCGLWLSGWGRGANPLPGGCSDDSRQKGSVASSSHEVLRLRPLAGVFS